ncbi:sensor domain-containing protein [Candidatus Mycobacterium wuenschmannii]|uniref:Sensor domain-containing protein n=1 Tax=Candidatus Mycobacterium wuenschmannii TaxID=3027808 RepID=A0ABY8VYX8_9MYCO|nr:sensor domain-containing protein [Candidatus Mycobacterium wuenschmannii]WIM88501.1 sensor domain-containing protein [Candidatus Mycobacterium wuenschmannii]
MRLVHGFAALLTAAGVLVASPAAAIPVVAQSKIDALLLSDDDVSSIVGLPLRRVGDIRPKPGQAGPLPDRDDCRSFVQSDVSLWTAEFTAFRRVQQRDDPETPQFAVTQSVALYPNAMTAAGTFRRAFAPDMVGRCGSVTLTDTSNASWRIDKVSITGNHASWMLANLQDGQDTTWRCANEIRQKGNAMFMEFECQYGNGGPLVAQMANLIANRIPS